MKIKGLDILGFTFGIIVGLLLVRLCSNNNWIGRLFMNTMDGASSMLLTVVLLTLLAIGVIALVVAGIFVGHIYFEYQDKKHNVAH